ncbi:extracellular solute-binding protein [Rhodoligotrophos defluvii]|uniref:extracellular solute-binding protein n=1 Tax=Rhodoligotrophos defluvii TaxID=2561934 RepID=UPI00195F30F4|nr:extracellular solute-binding protein [Rhodoligotrophos defluvii]
MHGEPLYPATFSHFNYVNPEAPKGGTLTLPVVGTFDSLNPFILRGQAPSGLRDYVFESLMARGREEPFTLYGLIAETIDLAPDGRSVTFALNPLARFADGTPVTPEDIIFSWEVQRDQGRPNLRIYYQKVELAEPLAPRSVRFVFRDAQDRELPLILGLMPVLPKHRYDKGRFDLTSLERPLGSGPYVVAEVRPGASITYRRNPDYWGRDLALNRGRHNFDEIRLVYFRDVNSAFEAFKKGLVDVLLETDPGRWMKGFDFPAAVRGDVKKEAFRTGLPAPLSAFVFNTRRAPFSDIRVREALLKLFDAAWINRNFYFDQFVRTDSYFAGSELSAAQRPASEDERALLAPFPGAVRPDVLEGTYRLPEGSLSGRDRESQRQALDLLRAAGFTIRGPQLVDKATGKPFTFEILTTTLDMERLALAYARMLASVGITARIRQVDSSQFQARLSDYDFDVIPYTWANSLSPGNEQAFYWGSYGADHPGTRNYMGVESPAVDALIARMVAAASRHELMAATRALDRVLMSGLYVVPLFHPPAQWVARWKHIEHPALTPLYGYQIDAWWRAPS